VRLAKNPSETIVPALVMRRSGVQIPEAAQTVVLAEASSEPSKVDLQGLWRMRAGRSADPVLVLTTYPSEDGERVAASDSLRGSHPDHPGACGFLARHPPFGHGATSPERKSGGYPNPGSASPMHRLTPPI